MQNSALASYGRSSFLFFAPKTKTITRKRKPSPNLRAMSSSSNLAQGPKPEPKPKPEPEPRRGRGKTAADPGPLESVEAYHMATKHALGAYARGPHGLDWANQPNPFRRYAGAPVVPLDRFEPGQFDGPSYAQAFAGLPPVEALSRHTLSRLLFDSLALSAWKSAGYSTWSLRVNPSSGNLHPTEGYIVSGPVGGVSDRPFVAHYAPKEHALEIRAELPAPIWEGLVQGFPQETIFVGLTSIFWREAWKYGERAFRYCNHDVGHAIAAVSIAAACVGWDSALLDGWGNDEINGLLGLEGGKKGNSVRGPTKGYFPDLEQEHGDCLIALFPGGCNPNNLSGPSDSLSATLKSCMARVEWKGKLNALSKEHVAWGIIYQAALASHKHVTVEHFNNTWTSDFPSNIGSPHVYEPLTLRQVVRKRRSAVDMDGSKSLQSDTFYQMLLKASPSNADLDSQGLQQQLPFRVLPWKAELHMALFVHRVIGLPMGLYFLIRNLEHEEALRAAMRPDFEWVKPQGCPENLPLYRLASGDCRAIAKRLSCLQDIAGDGCFSLGMIARFKPILDEAGAWMYPRLFWESGVIGQVLYLEAHAVGISATGIGCYFDDAVHEVLGIKSKEFQSLYHFTVGAPVVDNRIMSLPPYPGPALDA